MGLVEVGVVVPAIITAVVIVGVGVVGFGGAAVLLVVFMLSVAGSFGPSAWSSGSFGFLGVAGLFLLPWSHRGLNKRRYYGL